MTYSHYSCGCPTILRVDYCPKHIQPEPEMIAGCVDQGFAGLPNHLQPSNLPTPDSVLIENGRLALDYAERVIAEVTVNHVSLDVPHLRTKLVEAFLAGRNSAMPKV